MSIGSVVEWSNSFKKNLWWRHALRLAAEKGDLVDNDLRLLLDIARMECGLEPKSPSFKVYTAPLILTGFGAETQAIKLNSIENVNHVSALVSNVVLPFQNEGITAIYGDNGSGKSSYAKILKNSCLTRGTTPKILSNIYGDTNGIASADITITVGDQKQLINWHYSDEPNENLKAIRIFDNTSASHYISDEDSISYKPAAMKLLSLLLKACEFVRKECEREKLPYLDATSLPIFKSGGKVSAYIAGLSAQTSTQTIDALCLTSEEELSIPTLNDELNRLKTSTPEQVRKSYSDRYKELFPLFQHLHELQQKFGQDSLDEIKKAYDDFKTKQGAAELARKQAIEGYDISGICTPEWKSMWSHVQAFVQTHNPNLSFPPSEGEPCPTCLQPISQQTAEKLKSFNEYLKDQTQIDANKAKRVFDTYIENLKILSFDLKPYEFVISKIESYKKEISDSIKELNSTLELVRNNLIKDLPEFLNTEVDFAAASWISGQIESLKQQELSVKTDEDLNKKILELNNTIEELEERKIFKLHKSSVLKEISRLKKCELFNSLAQSCQSTSITNQTNAIAKSGAIGKLDEVFHSELFKLGFGHFSISTETRGSRGQQMLKFTLKDKSNEINDIASEGEQKCIALAAFLAELSVDERQSTIIFDDPINSLDHKWRRKFAERIAIEALNRQVIVFTHDMPFLIMLKEATDRVDAKYSAISILKRGQLSGYPMPEPPWDVKSTKDRISYLNQVMPELKKHEDNNEIEQYEHLTRVTYNKMRETWERLVEEWLFKKVIERFGRSVKTQSLRDIVHKGGITVSDYEIIEAGMTKCSTFMYGHDQAPALSEGVPSYSEVSSDLNTLKSYFEELKRRRSK